MKRLPACLPAWLRLFALAAALAGATAPAPAAPDLVGHDTDLFTVNPNIPAQVPNVLLLFDNTANFSNNANGWGNLSDATCTTAFSPRRSNNNLNTQGDAQLCALYKVLTNLDEQINVGLMEFNDNVKGGYVRFPVKPMNATNKAALQAVLKDIATTPDGSGGFGSGVNEPVEKASQNSDYEGPLNDAWRYFNSFGTFTGVAADVVSKADTSAYNAGKTAFQFTSNTNTTSCGTDYIILMGNTFPKAASISPAIDNAASLLNDSANVTVDKSTLNTLTGGQARTADNWTKFLYYYGVKIDVGQYRPITTYTIDVCKDACDADQATLLASMATRSQGKYIRATSLDSIETALKNVFAEVQAVNSVFAATTLPVSINVRGTNLNQVYIGVFRPDSTLSPRWLGNLKHYKLGVVSGSTTGQLELIDASATTAVNLNTGFISNTATSIWTESSTFWSFRVSYPSTDVGKQSDSPDGDLVEKGGAAQKIRQFYSFPDSTTLNSDGSSMVRNIYTCIGTCSSTSPNNQLKNYLFNAANSDVTAQKLGTLSTVSVTKIEGSGTQATVTIDGGHSFAAGNSVVIAGASPSYYNGTYTVLSSPAPTGTKFYYNVTPSPNSTVDTTHAYATYSTTVAPSNALVAGTDKVTVGSADPSEYRVTGAATSAVSGASNQFSYAITSTTGSASGYTVTALRKLSSLVWSGGVVTATTPSAHGYSAANSVTVSGADDSVFNSGFIITSVPSTTTFTFNQATTPTNPAPDTTTGVVTLSTAVPSAWGNTPTVLVCGVTSSNYNTSASSCTSGSTTATTVTATVCATSTACSGVTPNPSTAALGTYFKYTTNASVTSAASSLVGATIQRVLTSDTSTFSVSSAAFTTASESGTFNISAIAIVTVSGSSENIQVTLNQGALTTAGTALRKLAIGDAFTIGGTCRANLQAGGTTVNCSTLSITAIAAASGSTNSDTSNITSPSTTAQSFNGGSVLVTLSGGSVPLPANLNNGTETISSATLVYAGSTTAKNGIQFTLNQGKFDGQALQQLASGDTVTFANCTYTVSGAANNCAGPLTAVSGNSSASASGSSLAANTFDNITGTVTVTIAPSNVASATAIGSVTSTTIARTGKTFSTALTTATSPAISSIGIGPQTVTATGTIYAAKSGDLTSLVSSITSQGTASGTITAALANSADPAERENLIAWVRGLDNKDNENTSTGSATDIRASAHGDVLHSRPAVVNYNRYGDENDVYIFYGTNDGMLHAVKGGAAAKGLSLDGGGKEQWAFIPSEFFGKLKRGRDQSPTISSSSPRDYGFDGPIAIYTRDANSDNKIKAADGDKVYLYLNMRRGGRMIYALDVTDPLDPKLLWKKGCTDATGNGNTSGSGGCDVGFEQMGQSWSEPKLGYLRKWSTTLALMFAAGNDSPAELPQPCFISNWTDTAVEYRANATVPTPMDTTNCPVSTGTVTSVQRTMGRGVFILNAETGAILWRAGPEAGATKQVAEMTYAMPGDLAVMKNRTNVSARTTSFGTESVTGGYMDRIYVTDTGGNIWRIDVADDSGTSSDAPAFVVSRLAIVAQAPVTGSHPALYYRKFLFNPDVVYATGYDAVVVGSGDREHPFDAIVQNRFYMFKDKNTGSLVTSDVNTTSSDMTIKWAAPTVGVIKDSTSSTDLFDVTNNCLGNAAGCDTGSGQTQTTAKTDLASAKGWKFRYTTTGEKTVAPATTAAGAVIFNTNEPKQDTVTGTSGSGACTSDLGTARQYGLSYSDATSAAIFSTLPSKYVPTAGGGRYAVFAGGGFLPQPVPVVVQIGGKYYQTVIAGVQTTNPGGLKLQSRVRTYWYKKVD